MFDNLTNGITIVMEAPPITYFQEWRDCGNLNDDVLTSYNKQKKAEQDRKKYNRYVKEFMRDVKEEIAQTLSEEITKLTMECFGDVLNEIETMCQGVKNNG